MSSPSRQEVKALVTKPVSTRERNIIQAEAQMTKAITEGDYEAANAWLDLVDRLSGGSRI